jgi:ubiquinone/menaquinone biosynthesis C-methylase UbiE
MRSVFRRAVVSFLLAAACVVAAGLSAQQRDPRQYQQVLENPDRLESLHVDQVVKTLGITPGMRIADLGAGTGVFAIPLATAAGPTGKVYAIDIDAGLLEIVSEKAKAAGVASIQNVLAAPMDPNLPDPVDLLFICDTMHHLPNQAEYVKQFAKLLRPGGRVVIIDFAEGKWPAGHESFAITPAQVDLWMKGAGFTRTATHAFLPTNFFHVYQPSAPAR